MTQNSNITPLAVSTNLPDSAQPDADQPSSRFIIVLAWIIVLFPAGWGIYLTALRASKLFR